jgi:hypothetical protein
VVSELVFNPTGVAPNPRHAATPLGLCASDPGSQGCFIATLGFGPESLWDSAVTAKTIEARRDAETAKLKTFLAELGYE